VIRSQLRRERHHQYANAPSMMMMMMMMMKGFCSFLFVRFSFNAANNLFLSCSAAFSFFFFVSLSVYNVLLE
jgi:hypothetical protein